MRLAHCTISQATIFSFGIVWQSAECLAKFILCTTQYSALYYSVLQGFANFDKKNPALPRAHVQQ